MMADPLTPEQRQRFEFESLNRSARRALAHRAKAARRSAWDQWRKENPIQPSGSNNFNRIVIKTNQVGSNFTTAPSPVPRTTEPTAPADLSGTYVFKTGDEV